MTGIARYTYEVSKYLKNDSNLDVEFFYGYYSSQLKKPKEKTLTPKNQTLKSIARKVIKLMSKLNTKRYETYWQPNFIPNPNIKADKVVTTFHDFSFEHYKEFHPKERIQYFQQNINKVLQSDLLITGSYYIKDEIVQRLKIDEKKIKVIYHGINHDIFKKYDDIKIDINLPDRYILSVGSIEPRKNLSTLIKAYNNLSVRYKEDFKLVIVGASGWENSELLKLIDKNNIIFLSSVSDQLLAYLYNKAYILVYPSFYEGFGLPPIEAMACGCPVITSNTSSMPEICKDFVLYFDPKSIEELTVMLQKSIENQSLMGKLSKDGLDYSKKFTWEKSYQEHKKYLL